MQEKDYLSYKIIDGEGRIGANLIEIQCNGKTVLIECGTELEPTEEGSMLRAAAVKKHYDACFITHCHADHAGLLAVPVNCDTIYMGEATLKILQTIDGICQQNAQKTVTFADGERIDICGLTVTPVLCDHSAYDSYMLYFKTGKGDLLYTGDFRAHGRKNFNFTLKKLPRNIDVLICENTNSGGNIPRLSEKDVENKLVEILKGDRPVFVLQSATNIDRIVSVYRAAVRTDRNFIMRLIQADICSLLPNIPQPNGFKRCYAYPEFPLTEEQFEKYREKYKNRFVGREYISKAARPVVEVTTKDLLYLTKLAKERDLSGAILVYSLWDGYKQKPDVQQFLQGVQALGMDVISLHASGHADGQCIDTLLSRVNAKKTVFVHGQIKNG